MKCPKCEFDNREGAKFCLKCGEALELKCTQCGKTLPAEALFCDECGQKMAESEEIWPVDSTALQSYTPKFLADKILTNRNGIEGERKLVTVLFADVAGYTSMAERLDPEDVHQIMDGCFQVLMEEIHRYEGTINQFIGDGVMALFGAPVAHEDHAQRACHAALSIQEALAAYDEKIAGEYGVAFKMRIGLNSGEVIVGSIGDDLRMDYTAIGNTTNLAHRMEGMAEPGTVVVSKDTYKIARDFFEFESLGKVQLKGTKDSQEPYELIGSTGIETRIQAAKLKGLTKFVGRERELETLKESFEKARSGSGQVVGIVGEAGVGKSRLLLELQNTLSEGEYTHLEGRCLHFGGSMAYLPVLDILRSYVGSKEGDQEAAIKKRIEEKIHTLDKNMKGDLPSFYDLLSLKVEDAEYLKLEPKQKREKTFEAIRKLLIQLSHRKPLVLVFEDVHWIDKTSEEFLSYLIGSLANTSVMLMLLYRPEYTHPWGSKTYYTKIGVDQLSTNKSAELVQAILEEGEVVPELRELILGRTTGNPLFLEELTTTLLENGSIEKKGKQYVLNKKVSADQIPETIQGIIAGRIDRLEDNLKRTMQLASVIGRDFLFRILQTITGMREELKSYLLNLQGLEFIYEKRLFPELEYIFKHALIQEVSYNSLLGKRKKEIHEKIGEAIEELYPERLEEFYEMLAYHYAKSDNLEKAYRYLKLSGEKAVKSFSNWEAIRFCREAMSVLDKLPDERENKRKRLEVLLLMASSMFDLAYPEEDSLQILEEGERLSRELGDERASATFLATLSMFHLFRGDPRSAQYIEKAFEASRKAKDVNLMASVAVELCLSYQSYGEYQKIVDASSHVVGLLEEKNKKADLFGKPFNPYSVCCTLWGASRAALGDFEEGEALAEKALCLAREINHLPTLGPIESLYGHIFTWKGDGKSAVKHLEDSVRYHEEAQALGAMGVVLGGLGFAHFLLGDFPAALRIARKGLDIHLGSPNHSHLSYIHWALGMISFGAGDLKEARTCAEEALKLSQQCGEKQIEGLSWALLGRVLGKSDPSQFDKAKEHIFNGFKILEDMKVKAYYSQCYLYLGELYADAGQREEALENLKKAEGMFQEMGMDYWLSKTQEVLGQAIKETS